MTDTTLTPKQNPAEAVPYDQIKDLVAKATANPATLQFPTDKWGFTSQIKKEVLKAGSTVRGQDDKHDLLIGTLSVLIRHLQLRKSTDLENAQRQLKRIEQAQAERAPRERVGAAPSAPVTE